MMDYLIYLIWRELTMHKFNISQIYSYVLHGLITAIIVLACMIILKDQMPPKLVKVDLVAITTHYTQLMLKDATNGSTDNPAVKKISDMIKNNLEPVISEYAKTNNVVVIQAQALVDVNTPDITSQIIEQLDKKLK